MNTMSEIKYPKQMIKNVESIDENVDRINHAYTQRNGEFDYNDRLRMFSDMVTECMKHNDNHPCNDYQMKTQLESIIIYAVCMYKKFVEEDIDEIIDRLSFSSEFYAEISEISEEKFWKLYGMIAEKPEYTGLLHQDK